MGKTHDDPRAMAAYLIQRRFLRRSASRLGLRRTALISRLKLEQQILVGIRIMLASLGMMLLFTAILRHDMRPEVTYDLRQSIVGAFSLDQVGSIRDLDGFREYYKALAQQTQERLSFSSSQFADDRGQIRLVTGLQIFSIQPVTYATADVSPAITTAFTLTGMVSFGHPAEAAEGAYAVRKRLTQSTRSDEGADLSCWAWVMGASPSLEYGAHDYGPLIPGPSMVTVSSRERIQWPTNGQIVFQAVVVNETHAEFFHSSLDAVLTGNVSITEALESAIISTGSVELPRPVTDCGAPTFTVGDPLPSQVTAAPECPPGASILRPYPSSRHTAGASSACSRLHLYWSLIVLPQHFC